MRTTIRSSGNQKPGGGLPPFYYLGWVRVLGRRRLIAAFALAERLLSRLLHRSFGALQDVL